MNSHRIVPEWSDDDPRWSRTSLYDPPETDEADSGDVWDLPLPRADRRDLLDPRAWRAAEAALAADLARTAQAVGRLDEAVFRLGPGAIQRLAYREVEAMSRAEGVWLDRDRIGRSMLAAGGDPERARVLGRARWALRRLCTPPGAAGDLRRFLGLHEINGAGRDIEPGLPEVRPIGPAFEAAEADWRAALDRLGPAHPLTAALFGLRAWRLAGLSAPEDVIEAATGAGRAAALENRALPFVPLAPRGLSWGRGGAVENLLALWLAEIRDGALTSLAELERVALWQQRALAGVANLGGANPGRVISALAARPYATAEDLATAAGVSRDTAERLLPKLLARGLVREITGRGRFRLWAAGT
ncbi:hypothetical protein [Falsirhodobacter xinxiangensis]|uniref:hypothetical protein n=1 Tax=Falsirhodobacter xinxiangensis TaxID=2530049 RepID=UPI0010AABB40|nr:hypothetical protein [Rhodobacter xinxiangensis]